MSILKQRHRVRYLGLALIITLVIVNSLLCFLLIWQKVLQKTSLLHDLESFEKTVGPHSFQSDPGVQDYTSRIIIDEKTENNDNSQLTEDILRGAGVGSSKININLGVFDNSRKFKSHMFSVTGDGWSKFSSNRLVCLGSARETIKL